MINRASTKRGKPEFHFLISSFQKLPPAVISNELINRRNRSCLSNIIFASPNSSWLFTQIEIISTTMIMITGIMRKQRIAGRFTVCMSYSFYILYVFDILNIPRYFSRVKKIDNSVWQVAKLPFARRKEIFLRIFLCNKSYYKNIRNT